MCKEVKRGYVPTDEKEFKGESVKTLISAGRDIYYLLNHGYRIKGASVFVGNHYLLSERQRLALARGISAKANIEQRKKKEIVAVPEGSTVNIDGFNTIITLEVALADSLLVKCMDGTVRDLAGLRGTYRIIDKTREAIRLIGDMLEESKVGKAIFYLDAPVSNSGRLKEQILKQLCERSFAVEVETINNVDSVLETKEQVITSDAIILDKCKSWINLNAKIMSRIPHEFYIDFSTFIDDLL